MGTPLALASNTMKTKLQIFKILALLPVLLLQVNCSKKKSGGGAVAAPGYYMNNGQCMATNGQPVPMNYCPNGGFGGYGTNTGYYMNGAQCMNAQNQVVAITFCQQQVGVGGYGGGFGGYGGGYGQQCVGFYYFNSGYGYQSVYCSGFDCSGYQLLNSLGQPVFCQ